MQDSRAGQRFPSRRLGWDGGGRRGEERIRLRGIGAAVSRPRAALVARACQNTQGEVSPSCYSDHWFPAPCSESGAAMAHESQSWARRSITARERVEREKCASSTFPPVSIGAPVSRLASAAPRRTPQFGLSAPANSSRVLPVRSSVVQSSPVQLHPAARETDRLPPSVPDPPTAALDCTAGRPTVRPTDRALRRPRAASLLYAFLSRHTHFLGSPPCRQLSSRTTCSQRYAADGSSARDKLAPSALRASPLVPPRLCSHLTCQLDLGVGYCALEQQVLTPLRSLSLSFHTGPNRCS